MSNLARMTRFWAKKTPKAPSVFDKNGVIDYQELNRLTDEVALFLISKGIQREEFVSVYVRRNRNILIGAIAAVKAGGAYLPIDAAYPEERCEFIQKDAECRFILTEKNLWDEKAIPSFLGEVIFLDEVVSKTLTDEEDKILEDAEAEIMSDYRAMLLYTSGTTGNPKGVVHTHSSINAIIDSFSDGKVPLTCESKVGVFAGFTFIASAHSMFSAVYAGGSAHIVSEELRSDLDGLYRYIRKSRLTHILLPPSLGVLMAEKNDMSTVAMLLGGEKMQPLSPKIPCEIYNVYGSTEGVIIAEYPVSGNESEIPIGRPTSHTTIRIVDENGQPVDIGETGELLYNSPCMAKEYFHLPEMTKRKWTYIDGKRFYHTGDRVRQDEAGLLWYVGRADDMVKIRGFRVELGEVESRISSCGGKNFACVVRKVRGADKLCCFYENGGSFDADAIKEEISKTLAFYMVPELWIALDMIPRNPNGKISKRDLPTPEIDLCEYVPPSNDVPAMIVKHIEELLEIPRVGMNDSFIAMGGDSLRAMSLTSRLRKRGIILSSADILQAGTVGEICEKAKVEYEKIWEEDEWEGIQKTFLSRGERIQKVLPLSKTQEATLLKQLLYPDDPKQVKFYSLLIDCTPDEKDMRNVLNDVCDKFECLRAAVVYHDVSAIQQVITDRKLPLEICNVKIIGEAQTIAEEFYEENNPYSFDLEEDAQMRFRCIHLPGNRSLILVAVRRFILDEKRLRWYFSEIFRSLQKSYPESLEIPAWIDLLSMGISDDDKILREEEADGSFFASLAKNAKGEGTYYENKPPEPVYTYSDIEGAKKFVFVHTANTGSEAYYNLAKRISDKYSFAVIEQYNLYHTGQEVYGIKKLAHKYVEILKEYQPNGPYNLGGWCYGGMLAYEMACILEERGEIVENLVLLDSQTAVGKKMKKLSKANQALIRREYFETCHLFEDMRAKGMLEKLIFNYQHVARDVVEYVPTMYKGKVLYFKPEVIPEGSVGAALQYQKAIHEKKAGGYEAFIVPENLDVLMTPHEHDLMMDDMSLDIIVPKLMEIGKQNRKVFQFPATFDSVETLKFYIMRMDEITQKNRLDLCLLAEEIMVNIISYAYERPNDSSNKIEVWIELDKDICYMTFIDSGRPFNQQKDQDASKDYDPLSQIGGAGRLLVQRLADETFYEYRNEKNIFGFSKSMI